MAKLDIESLQALKRLRRAEREQFREFLRVYHSLASIYQELKTQDDKYVLVSEHPEIAAQIFYYFDDSELGDQIVQRYDTDTNSKKRQLAHRVYEVLQVRDQAKDRLENVLHMHSQVLPLREEFEEESKEREVSLAKDKRTYA